MAKFNTLLTPAVMAGLLLLFVTASTATSGAQEHSDFIRELNNAIFARTEGPGAAKHRPAVDNNLSRERKFLELLTGENIEFTALPTRPEWEEKLIPIRIPLRKGLQGYRLLFINKQDQEAFAKVDTLEQLKTFPTGAGAQWSTTKALEAAGFAVLKAPGRDELVRMLSLRRFMTFGRGVDEIFFEHSMWAAEFPSLMVEKEFALFIPHPIYYFVTPKRPDLAERIERGLREMISDGSFDRLSWKYYGDDIIRARLDQRRIFSIPNPLLGPQTPLDDPSLWLDPGNIQDAEAERSDLIR